MAYISELVIHFIQPHSCAACVSELVIHLNQPHSCAACVSCSFFPSDSRVNISENGKVARIFSLPYSGNFGSFNREQLCFLIVPRAPMASKASLGFL